MLLIYININSLAFYIENLYHILKYFISFELYIIYLIKKKSNEQVFYINRIN